MIAEIIAAGSEMLTPHRLDTNSLYMTEQLNDLGVVVAFKSVVGDSLEHLTSAARVALSRADIVLFSGGLGPTRDDLTREAVAAALNISLERREDLMVTLRERYAARGIAMPTNNAQQADMLSGAEVLPNPNGSAVGQYLITFLDHDPRIVILLPGPPKELKPLFTAEVKPRLAARLPPSHLRRRLLRMALIPESQVDARCAPIYDQYPDVETTILAGSAEIQLHFVCGKPSAEEAQARVDEVAGRIEGEMEESIFSAHGESLEEIVLLHLGMRGLSVATAESCTGGLLAERLTAMPGFSQTYLGGAVVYTEALKTAMAGVPPELLASHGAISAPVAQALADGIRARAGASVGIATTGLAGPTGIPEGPDSGKPVGLVYVAVSGLGPQTEVRELNLTGDRERIRLWTTQHALELVRRLLL
jgi:nicotinamide-nucleotide amidase